MILSMVLVSSIKEMTLIWPPHAGKPTTRIAAVQIALHYLLDDGSEEAGLSLKTGLIFSQELVKVMEEHTVEHGAFRMSGAIDSCHSKELSIKKCANPQRKRIIAEMKGLRKDTQPCATLGMSIL
ncbi:hypothetical protein ES703_48979 [subsurface metagenome]